MPRRPLQPAGGLAFPFGQRGLLSVVECSWRSPTFTFRDLDSSTSHARTALPARGPSLDRLGEPSGEVAGAGAMAATFWPGARLSQVTTSSDRCHASRAGSSRSLIQRSTSARSWSGSARPGARGQAVGSSRSLRWPSRRASKQFGFILTYSGNQRLTSPPYPGPLDRPYEPDSPWRWHGIVPAFFRAGLLRHPIVVMGTVGGG